MVFGKLIQFGKKAGPQTFKAKYMTAPRQGSAYPIRDKIDPEIGHYPMGLLNVRPGMTYAEANATLGEAMPGASTNWVFNSSFLALGVLYFDDKTTILKQVSYSVQNLRGPVTIEGIQLPASQEQAMAALKDLRVNEAKLATDTYLARGKYVPQPVYAASAGSSMSSWATPSVRLPSDTQRRQYAR